MAWEPVLSDFTAPSVTQRSAQADKAMWQRETQYNN